MELNESELCLSLLFQKMNYKEKLDVETEKLKSLESEQTKKYAKPLL